MTRKTSLVTVFCSFACLLLVLLGTSLPAMAAPTVTSTSPADGATWVSEFAPVTAIFSEAMDPATITSNSFTLEKQVGVVAVAAGAAHTVALRGDGTVVAWGNNGYGQTMVPAGLNNVVAIAAGETHTLALKEDGTVVAWGIIFNEMTGDYEPVTVPAGLSGVVAIAAGDKNSVALKSNGKVIVWGCNIEGEMTVPVGLSGVVAIAAGTAHIVALKEDGTVVTWGRGEAVAVPAGLNSVVAITAGGDHTVALKGDGTVVAWGDSSSGQTTVPTDLNSVVAIATGGYHTVALKGDGTVVAWGDGSSGQTTVPAGLNGVVAIAAGGYHTVALKGDGTVVAWGLNQSGQTTVPPRLSGVVAIAAGGCSTVALKGDGTVVSWGCNFDEPAMPEGLSDVVKIDAGWLHTIALKGDGTVVVWGINYEGQTTVPAGLNDVVAIAAGMDHTVALKGNGTVVAWGDNRQGETAVPSELSGVVAIAAGSGYTVALKGNRTVVAWGQFYVDTGYVPVTVPEDLNNVVAVAAGENHIAALKDDGTVVAWGANESGQTTVPEGLSNVVAIAAGSRYTAALKGDGTVVAWGRNYEGQTTVPEGLGDVVAIDARYYYAISLKGDGTVVAWGSNNYGESTIPVSLDFVPVKATVAFNAASQEATLTPDAPLGTPAVYRATAFAKNSSHVCMAGSESWNFSTGGSLASYLVTPKAGMHGKISPTIGQLAIHGTTAGFTLIPDTGYMIDTVDGCGGSLVGSTYTTGPISQACSVTAKFRILPAVAAPTTIDVPAANATGSYTISWGTSTMAGVAYVLQEATNATFTANLRQAYAGTALSAAITGRSSGVTYYYRVRAQKAGYSVSAYATDGNGCAVTLPCAVPASLTVPATSTTGSYTVSWGASTTAGVTYVLQEATNATFTAGLRQAYAGTGTSANIGGRASGKTYYYRVRAQRAGYSVSGYATAGNGCVVTLPCAVPASLTVPASDSDGSYAVSWGASTTAGVIYVLQEATNATFTTGLRQAYAGTGTSANISGRTAGRTYYYRVRAQRAGYSISGYRTAVNGCLIGP